MKIRTATQAQTPEALLNDLRTLVSDAELMLNDSPDENDCATPASLGACFDTAQKRFADFCTAATNTLAAAKKYTDGAIRTNPYRALALALGAGLIVGVLLGCRAKQHALS